MKRILDFVTRYSPQEQDLNTNLKPFIPELIPCIGDIDAFIKIPRPDHQDDELGLSFVDEPCAIQSDPSGICRVTKYWICIYANKRNSLK
jgi:intraflagellar transport protein 46